MSFCCLCLSVCVGVTQCGTCMVLRRQLPGIGSDSAPLLLEPSHWLLKIFWDILVTFKLFSYPRHQYVSDGNMACNFLSTLLPDVALPTLYLCHIVNLGEEIWGSGPVHLVAVMKGEKNMWSAYPQVKTMKIWPLSLTRCKKSSKWIEDFDGKPVSLKLPKENIRW